MKRFLIFCETVTNSHILRSAHYANLLVKEGHEVILAYSQCPSFVQLSPQIKQVNLEHIISTKEFLEDLKNWKFPIHENYF